MNIFNFAMLKFDHSNFLPAFNSTIYLSCGPWQTKEMHNMFDFVNYLRWHDAYFFL